MYEVEMNVTYPELSFLWCFLCADTFKHQTETLFLLCNLLNGHI